MEPGLTSTDSKEQERFLAHWKNLFRKTAPIVWKKKSMIISMGEEMNEIRFLKSGYVKSYIVGADGREFTAIIYKPGDFFPIRLPFTENSMSHYYYQALTDCTIYKCSKKSFVEFIEANPEFNLLITRRIVERFVGLVERLVQLVLGNAHSKLSDILLICASRFGKKVSNGVLIDVPLTHQEIASLTGITRETASIELKKLQDRKILGKRGDKYIIYDLDKLNLESKFDYGLVS